MKKVLFGLALLLGLTAKATSAPLYGYVQVTTTTALTPTLQNGTINVASGTIKNLKVTFGVNASTVAASSATITNTMTAGTFSGSGASLTNIPGANITGTIAAGQLSNAILLQSVLQNGATFYVSSGTVSNLNATSLNSTTIAVTTITPTGIVGTTTNNNANAGDYGEFISSTVANVVLSGGVFVNIASISLSAGDWNVTGQAIDVYNGNSASTWSMAVSVNSGNTTSDHVLGDNVLTGLPASSSTNSSLTVANYRLSLSGTTTVYLKISETGATLNNGTGRISARRVR